MISCFMYIERLSLPATLSQIPAFWVLSSESEIFIKHAV